MSLLPQTGGRQQFGCYVPATLPIRTFDARQVFTVDVGTSYFPGIASGTRLLASVGVEPEPGDIVVTTRDSEFILARYVPCGHCNCHGGFCAIVRHRQHVYGVVVGTAGSTSTPRR